MVQQSQEQLTASTEKVDMAANELWRITRMGSETQQRLLQHTAGTLSVGVKLLEDELSRIPQKDMSSSKRYSHPMMNADAEKKIERLKNDLRKRDQEIKSQRAEIEQLRSDNLHDIEFEANNNVQIKEREIRELRTELEQLHNGLDFLVRRHQINGNSNHNQSSDVMTTSSASEDSASWDDSHGGTDFGFKSVHTSTTSITDIRTDEYSSTAVPTHTSTLNALDKLLKHSQSKMQRLESEAEEARVALEQSQQMLVKYELQSQRQQEYGKEIEALKSQNIKLQENILELEAENAKHREDAENTHKNNNSVLEKEVEHARQQLEKLEVDLYSLTELLPIEKSHQNSSELSLIELAAVKIRDIVSENMRIEETMKTMESAIQEHETERKKMTAELQASKMQLQSRPARTNSPTALMDTRAMEARERALQRELQQFKSEVFELRTQREDWERNVDTKSAADSQHEEMTHQMEEAKSKHEHEVEMLQGQLDFLGQENERLKCETESFEKQFNHNKQVLDNMKNEINVKENSISTLKLEICKIQEMLEQKIKSENSLFAAEQQMHKNHDAQMEMLNREVGELEAKMRQNAVQAEELIASKNQRLTAANEQIERLEQELMHLRNQVSQYGDKQPDNVEMRRLKAEIEELHRNREMLETELGISQKQLREAQDGLLTAQSQFTVRESALLLQSSSIEADFEAIFKEYERLTRNITDFASERQAYDERIQELLQYKNKIQTELADEKVRCLQMGTESNSTQTLRREFRKLMSDVKAENVRELERAEEERKKLESTLRNIRREEEKRRWEKQSTGVQTNFVFEAIPM
jgi:chromosome segregation ATPase